MGKPRNFDRCWIVDATDGEHVSGHRETRGFFGRDDLAREQWYPLEVGSVKIFPQAVVLIVRANDFSFEGTVLTAVAIYDEVEL